uniref:Uncharacterized protein n=1 Tax=Meloidogyne hapla TaxID=6305 RepID=A0A1I8BMF8_MELHA
MDDILNYFYCFIRTCFPVCFDTCEATCDKHHQIKTPQNNQRRLCAQTCHFDCQRSCAEKQQQKQARRRLGGTELFSLGTSSPSPTITSAAVTENNNEMNNNLQQQQTVINGPATNCVARCPKSCVVSCLSTQTNEDPTICVPACVAVCAQSCSRGLQHFDSLPQQNKAEQIQQQIQQILLQGQRNEGLENGTSYSNVTVQSENNGKKQMLVTQPTMFLNDVDRELNDGLIRSRPCAPLCRPQCQRECTLKYVEERHSPFSTYSGRKRGFNNQRGLNIGNWEKRLNQRNNKIFPPHYILPLNEALKEGKNEENKINDYDEKSTEIIIQQQNQTENNNTNNLG